MRRWMKDGVDGVEEGVGGKVLLCGAVGRLNPKMGVPFGGEALANQKSGQGLGL